MRVQILKWVARQLKNLVRKFAKHLQMLIWFLLLQVKVAALVLGTGLAGKAWADTPQICLLAENNKMVNLSVEAMPAWISGQLYIPYTAFDRSLTGVNLGVSYGQEHTESTYTFTLYSLRGTLVFDLNAAATGLSEKAARRAGIPCDSVYLLPPDKVSLMPDADYLAFKLVFETPTGRLLGAQAIGRGDAVRRVDVIAAMLSMNATLADLKELELCYSPVYGTAKDVVNLAALAALNLLEGRVRQAPVTAVRQLVESGAYIIDVREESEWRRGHLKNAVNIPLSQFRRRMAEVPRDRPVYLHCRTGQRSYYALCELLGSGYTNAYNISGSFLGVCLYEYFNDVTQHREPIVTAYNFR